MADLPYSAQISDALSALNRLNIPLDLNSCFYQDRHRVCLTTARGVLTCTVDGIEIPWRKIVPTLKARPMVPISPPPLTDELRRVRTG